MSKKKPSSAEQASNVRLATLAMISLVLSYGFISLAIEKGSILSYIFSFVAFYYSIHYIKQFIKDQFFNNDKKPRARKTSKSSKRR